MKKVLVTGATGYIGSNLVKRLLKEHWEVHIVIRPQSKMESLAGIEKGFQTHVHQGSTQGMIEIMHKAFPDIIVHLASLFIAEHQVDDLQNIIRDNVLFSTQLLEAAARNGVKYFINTGTHWQNYSGEEYNPVNLYAATKQAVEVIAKYYTESTEMRMLTIKLCDTYGPSDRRPKIMSLLKRISVSGETLDMSPGAQEIGLVYIDDVVKGFMLAINRVKQMQPHEQFNCFLAPKEIYKLKEVVRIYQEVIGASLSIAWGKRKYRKREMMKMCCAEDIILDPKEMIGLEEGIKTMLDIENGK